MRAGGPLPPVVGADGRPGGGSAADRGGSTGRRAGAHGSAGRRPGATAPGLAPFAGRRVAAIDITGHNVTKDWVITREIRTKVGDPLDIEAVGRDVARLDNLSIFAEIQLDGEPVGDDGVRLVFTFKEMPSWFPILSYVYTEENGFSWGAGLSAGNLTGRDLSVSARVYFGDLEQQWSRISWPWIRGNHVSFDFYGARYTRPDALRGFEETSYEFTPEVGTWFGEHGWARAKFSYFEMKSDTRRHHPEPGQRGPAAAPRSVPRLGHPRLVARPAAGLAERDRAVAHGRLPRRRRGLVGGQPRPAEVGARHAPDEAHVLGARVAPERELGKDVPSYLNYFMGGANTHPRVRRRGPGRGALRQEPDAGHGGVLADRHPAAALGPVEDLAPARGGGRGIRRRGHRLERVARLHACGAPAGASGAACVSWCRARRWCAWTWAGARTTASSSTSRTGPSRGPSASGCAEGLTSTT